MASAPDGGAEMTMLDCVRALSGIPDFSQYIVTRPNNSWRLEQFSELGIGYATTNLNPSLGTLSRYKLARVIERYRPDIIQYWKARAGRFTFSKYRDRSIAWHGGTARLNRLSGCDWHIGSSAMVVTDLLEGGANEERVFHVSPFASTPMVRPLSRSQFGIPQGAPIALVMSRLHAKKGLNTLLEATRSVAGVHVLIAGDGPMRGALRAQIKAQRLSDRVHLLGWRNDRAELYDLADFVICPSKIEPFGKVVVEAWAAAKPVIAADAIGPATLITPGETGILFRRGDDDALAAAIEQLLHAPDMAKNLGRAGREAYEAEYGEQIFVKQMADLYKNVRSTVSPLG